MANAKQSLSQKHAGHWEVPVLLVLAAVTLAIGYVLPLMRIETLVFWQDDYTLLTSIRGLWDHGDYALAVIIFIFSILFPVTKLIAMGVLWWKAFDDQLRRRVGFAVSLLGKWSMLDVFVCALLIVMTQSKSFVDASPRAGLFIFAAAIALSMVVSIIIEYLVWQAE